MKHPPYPLIEAEYHALARHLCAKGTCPSFKAALAYLQDDCYAVRFENNGDVLDYYGGPVYLVQLPIPETEVAVGPARIMVLVRDEQGELLELDEVCTTRRLTSMSAA